MKDSAQKYGVAWYSPEAWARLKVMAPDSEALEDTYEEWQVTVESALKKLNRQGLWLEKVEIDIDALLAWCTVEGRAADAAARAAYAAVLLQQRYLCPTQGPAEPTAVGDERRKGDRPKGLSAKAQQVAIVAQQLYQESRLPIEVITEQLNISKSTLYRYLRHQGVTMVGKRRHR